MKYLIITPGEAMYAQIQTIERILNSNNETIDEEFTTENNLKMMNEPLLEYKQKMNIH